MKKQLYPIQKTDWCVTWGRKSRGAWRVTYRYAKTLKEAKTLFKGKRGLVQYFKCSYEFRSVEEQ